MAFPHAYSYKDAVKVKRVAIWPRAVMGIAGALLLVAGGLFDTWGNFDNDINFRGFGEFSGWGVLLIVPGIAFGIAAFTSPKGILRSSLVAVGIPIIFFSVVGLITFFSAKSICGCS